MKFLPNRQEVKVLGVYSSKHPSKEYNGDDYFVTVKRDGILFNLEGVIGDRHHGYDTISGGRFTTLYQRGTQVRNNRQWSAISPAEVTQIAQNLGIEERLTPELLGMNLLLEGIDNLSELPPMTYILFSPHQQFEPRRPEDVALVVYGQALPCQIAGRALVKPMDDITMEKKFPAAANGYRGTTGWVEKGGIVRPGYTGFVLTPTGKD